MIQILRKHMRSRNLSGVTTTPDFRTTVMRQFEPDLAMALVEYGKSLRAIDADALMFMARKSLCLYDVLTRVTSDTAADLCTIGTAPA